MAEGAQSIDTIGVALTLDTSQFDARLAASQGKASAARSQIEAQFSRALRAQPLTVSPTFSVTQAQVRGLRTDINRHMSSLAARNEAVSISVKLGPSDFAGIRNQISQRIGQVPIHVTVSSQSAAAARAGARTAVGSGPVGDLLASWIAGSQGVSLQDARRQIVTYARQKGVSARATGGPVAPGKPYLVGENGPEIFQPRGGGGTVKPISYGPGFAHRAGGGDVFKKHATELEEWKRNLRVHAQSISRELAGSARDWYPIARAQAMGDLADFGRPGSLSNIAAFAAASPGQPWPNNRAILREILERGAATSTVRRDVPGFGMTQATAPYGYANWAKAAEILKTGNIGLLQGPKVVPFFGNLSGQNPNLWTLDARQMRIASANRITAAPGGGTWQRAILEKAHEDLFPVFQQLWGVQNRSQAQAILWAGYGRGEDLGSDFARTAAGITIPRHPGILVPRHRGGITPARAGAFARMLRSTIANQGGTFDVNTGESPTTGYAAGIYPGDFRAPSNRDIRAMMEALRDAQRYGAPYVGTWMEEGADTLAVDPVMVDFSRRGLAAVRAGTRAHQKAIYDIRRQQEIQLKHRAGGGYCSTCGTSPRSMAVHLSTAEHRRRTTPRLGRRTLRQESRTRLPQWARGTGWDPLPDEAYEDEDGHRMGGGYCPRCGGGHVGMAEGGKLPSGYHVTFQGSRDPGRLFRRPPYWVMRPSENLDPFTQIVATAYTKSGEMAGDVPFTMRQFTPQKYPTLSKETERRLGSAGLDRLIGRWFLHPEMTNVQPGHRGKGLASAMYRISEAFTGHEAMPSESQTEFGQAFWAQKNRPFGRSWGVRPFTQELLKERWGIGSGIVAQQQWEHSQRELAMDREHLRESRQGWHNPIPGMRDPSTCALCYMPTALHKPGRAVEQAPLDRLSALMGSSAASDPDVLNLSTSGQWTSAPLRHRASGGISPESGRSQYLVGELAPELFVPDRMRYIIPEDVFSKLPKRDQGGATRRLNAGVMEVGSKGPHLFEPPEDGWIIPHNLVGRVGPNVPHAQHGRRGRGPTPIIGIDPADLEDARAQFRDATQDLTNMMRQDLTGAMQALSGRTFTSALTAAATAPARKTAFEKRLIAEQAVTRIGQVRAAGTEAITAAEKAREKLPAAQLAMAANQQQLAALEARRATMPGYVRARAELAATGVAAPSIQQITQYAQQARAAGQTWQRSLLTNERSIKTYTKSIDEGTKVIDEFHDMITAGTAAQGRIDDASKVAARAIREAQPSTFAKLKNLGTVLGAQFIAAQVVMAGMEELMKGAEPGVHRWIDAMTGFADTNAKVTAALAPEAAARGGRVQEAIAARGVGIGLSEPAVRFLSARLETGVTAKAAAQAESQVGDLFKAAAAGQAPTGLYGGYGGVLGTPFLAEGLGGGRGFTETIRSNLEALSGMNQGPIPQNLSEVASRGMEFFTNPGFRQYTRQQQPGNPTLEVAGNVLDALPTIVGALGQTLPVIGGFLGDGGGGAAPTVSSRDMDKLLTYQSNPLGLDPKQLAVTRAYLDDLGAAADRGSKAMGANTKVTWEMVDANSQQAKAAADVAAKAHDYESVGLAMEGIVMKINGHVATSAEEHQRAVEFAARGRSIPDVRTWADSMRQTVQAQRDITSAELDRQQKIGIPGQLKFQLAQTPFASRRQLFEQLGYTPQNAPAGIRRTVGATVAEQRGLQGVANQGMAAMMADITQNLGAGQAQQFSTYMGQAADYGKQIVALETRMASIQWAQRAREFASNMILANRALRDALGLAGMAGGSRFGQLQRQDYFLGRQAQSLTMQMTQRDINFQRATAGFTAVGNTPQEIAANIEETKVKTNYAQQELNIERERFRIGLEMFNISNQRAVEDAKRSKELLQSSYEQDKRMAAIVREIQVKEIAQGQRMAAAQAIFEASNKNFSNILQTSMGYVSQFGGTVKEATTALQTALGIRPKQTGHVHTGATGFVSTVMGAQEFLAGEAGPEHVIVLRNPKAGSMPTNGGGVQGGGMSMTLNINGPISVRDDSDIQKIAAAVEDRLNRRVSLLGLRRPGG